MALDDFERSLAQTKAEQPKSKRERSRGRDKNHRHRHHHHSDRHHESKHGDGDDDSPRHRPKRRRNSDDELGGLGERSHRKRREKRDPAVDTSVEVDEWVEKTAAPAQAEDANLNAIPEQVVDSNIQRDAWMQTPSALQVDYVQRKKEGQKPKNTTALQKDYQLKVHKNELNHHLNDLQADGKPLDVASNSNDEETEIDYTFGDAGASWRMMKLKGIYREAKSSGRDIDDVAQERYGNLKDFDDAREEEIELDRRQMYGKGYVGKEVPSGELFLERRSKQPAPRHTTNSQSQQPPHITQQADHKGAVLDQSALNKLKAEMMKAKLRNAPNTAVLEADYNKAVAAASHKEADVVTLNAMENRMLVGRQGEVNRIDNKRGRERGLVVENEDMSIDDMVRQERRTKGNGEDRAFAERIGKDAKFDNDLDYLDENATKLAKHVQKSEINLRNMAIEDFQKMSRILDTCPLCHHEDKGTGPTAPVVSLGTRVYLTLPTEPEISEGGACIVPIQHHTNLMECDEDEWEEIRNFMKCLIRMYHDQGREVIFYENAATPQRKKHAAMEAVPLPYSLGETAPAFFREAMMTADEEWSQHKKVIDTLAKARGGLGKLAFRRTLIKEMPYFHVSLQSVT
jgi:Protein similar to CwfJ C-terminus 1